MSAILRTHWLEQNKPIIGLSPMDGITDAAFRRITFEIGRPDVLFTEFTAVEGIRAGADRLMWDLLYSEDQHPTVAQLFGSDPSAFYVGCAVALEMGFDGIDINMGCPSKTITHKGAGAALINDFDRALAIIQNCQNAKKDWLNGKSLEEFLVPDNIIDIIRSRHHNINKRDIPISIKTRIGVVDNQIDSWIGFLAKQNISAIILHGRTFKQMYSGSADWHAIQRAAQICHDQGKLIIGNGDAKSRQDATSLATQYDVDGVLIGRSALGNPWAFIDQTPDILSRLKTALYHSQIVSDMYDPRSYVRMRKHLLDYLKSVPGVKDLKMQLARSNNHLETSQIILQYIAENQLD